MHIDRKIQFLIILLIFPLLSISQQLPQFTKYMFNTISINPAYAGSREKLNVSFLNRNQWVGINGAPVTQTFAMHSAVTNTHLGIGLSVINDKLGYENTFYAFGDLSYSINLIEDYWLSFGLKAGFSKYGLDADLLSENDRYLDNIFNKIKPNFGAGVYLRSDKFFLSLSSPKIISYTNNTDIVYTAIERASYYLMGGYLLEFTPSLKFKPTAMIKYTKGAPSSFDITANFLIKDNLWLGAAYRFGDAIGGYVSILAAEGLRIGYSYEFITSDLNPYTSGSHEIFISYEFQLLRPSCNCASKF
ncbi:type IX secretion system membrane protein PorP/SprF [Yeosuana marina]|uniref:PorP/SprF family type IX secretion system membrane protein n=1 Tax=Yeosuana marina TaxID=1565536 RepID=UPI0030EC20F1